MRTQDILATRYCLAAALLTISLSWNAPAFAHCDTLDGPVVAAARKALDSGNVNLVLVWVQKKDEAEIRNQFQKTVTVRKGGGPARDLADRRMEQGLHRQFDEVMNKSKYKADDIAAGRAFASAYVEYTHYVERLYEAAETLAPEPVQKSARAPAHSH